MRGVLDTSVFIASEQERPLQIADLPPLTAVSVVTLAELELGVHMAANDAVRARRLRTLRDVQTAYEALPIDAAVASHFAELVAAARRNGRRPRVHDAWIAATARANDAAVVTQDADFAAFNVDVIRV